MKQYQTTRVFIM